jgi:adenylyltransferase/sulfurtransferase
MAIVFCLPKFQIHQQISGSLLVYLPDIKHYEGVAKVKELLNRHRLIAAKVLDILKEAGIEGINVKGGITAWSQEVDSSVPQY